MRIGLICVIQFGGFELPDVTEKHALSNFGNILVQAMQDS